MRPIVQLREGEATTTLQLFLDSFLAMTSYDIIKRIGRGEFMKAWGADNLPYVQLAMGVLIGFIMQAYVKIISFVPGRYFMQDRDEDLWVRRHVPSALALLPCAASVAALEAALDDPDEFLRSKAATALERVRKSMPRRRVIWQGAWPDRRRTAGCHPSPAKAFRGDSPGGHCGNRRRCQCGGRRTAALYDDCQLVDLV